MTTNKMSIKSQRFLEPNFWPSSAMIWGFSTGNIIALTLLVAAAYSLFHTVHAVEIVCGLTLLGAVPTTIYLIHINILGRKMRSPAEIIGGFIACVLTGAILPVIFFPMLAAAIFEEAKERRATRRKPGRMRTGKEAFFSLPGSVVRHAGHEVATSFFNTLRD